VADIHDEDIVAATTGVPDHGRRYRGHDEHKQRQDTSIHASDVTAPPIHLLQPAPWFIALPAKASGPSMS
jgi:hypothetical protein